MIRLLLCVALIYPICSSAQVGSEASPNSPDRGLDGVAMGPVSPVSLRLSASQEGLDSGFARLTAVVSTYIRIDTALVYFALPDGLKLVTGDTTWSGALDADGRHEIEAVVWAERLGYFDVRGTVRTGGENWQDRQEDEVHLEVDQAGDVFEREPPNNWDHPATGYGNAFRACEEGVIETSLSFSHVPALGDTFTVTARVEGVGAVEAPLMYFSLLYPPEGFEMVSVGYPPGGQGSADGGGLDEPYGIVRWLGPSVQIGQSLMLSATLRVVDVGEGAFWAGLVAQGPTVADATATDLHVDRYRSWTAPVDLGPHPDCAEVRARDAERR